MKYANLFPGTGKRLKNIRRQLDYSKERMASFLGLSLSAYYKNELGKTLPGHTSLHHLAKDMDISLDWLLMGKGSMKCAENIKASEQGMKRNQEQEDQAGKSVGMIAKPEVSELLEHMEKIPLLYFEIMAYFQRFKVEHRELVETSMGS